MSAMKSQEASSASPCSYHVFLSFRGEDTRKTFTDHLYAALDLAGFRTFRDDDGIEKAENIKSELEKAIRESRISIIVFSKNYASSTWCLEELVMILKRRASGHVVLPVFYDVDPSEVRKQIGSFEEAFTRHEEKLKSETGELAKEKLKEKLGTWRAALREVANVAGMNLQNQVNGGHRKKVFVVLDDVDELDQLDALLGMRGLLFPGSKIIITTRRERLLGPYQFYKVHRLENMSAEESLELFSWQAFGKCYPDNGYGEVSKKVVSYCGGIPLAIKVLGSSLSGNCLNVWKSQLEKLKAIPESKIVEKLRISYDSLQDDHDKRLFLNLACFFVGSDKDSIVTILDGCEFYTVVGIQNLMDRCLISIVESKKLVMHHLLQQMGREIVRQESPNEPSKRSILWNHKDALDVLRENTGTSKIEGLKLDMDLLREDTYASMFFGDNIKRRYEKFLGKPLLSNFGGLHKRHGFSIFSSHLKPKDLENSTRVALEADAFARMHKLKLLQLSHVHISGPYKKFPKGLRWLCWQGFPLKSIPGDFPLESLVVLDMQYSFLKYAWEGTKFLGWLKILNLSHSYNLAKTPDFSELPNLERLVLKSCINLVEVHESIGCLERLVLLNLKDCKNLRNLPRSIYMLKYLETFVISGCSKLNGLPKNMGNMESLTVLKVDVITLNQSLPTSGQVNGVRSFILPWRLKQRERPEISWPSLPRSLVELSLVNCNLSEDDFPIELSNLCSLKELDLSCNQFSSLPDFVKGLTKLEDLTIDSCPRLRKLYGVPQVGLYCNYNRLLEEITFQISHRPTTICQLDACNHPETMSSFKLESIRNIDAEIVNNLGMSNLQSMENLTVKLMSSRGMQRRWFPLQICYEAHIICAYIPGSKVPPWFNFKNLGSSIDFIVPSYLNSRIRGLNLCSIYQHSSDPDPEDEFPHIFISNRTKGLVWSYCPWVFGTAEDGEDSMWLSYWKFGNHLEDGDEVNISVYGGECVQVKDVGVRLLYKEEPEEMSSHQLYQFGNIVPGNVSAHQPGTKLYQLGCHLNDCKYCQHLYPPPWIPTIPDYDYAWRVECWASLFMAGKSFYVSQDHGR